MKKLLLFSSIILISALMFASHAIPSFEEILRKEVNYPQFAKEEHVEGVVLVCFCVDYNGKIILKESNSDNELLRNYVVNKLSSMKLPATGSPEEEYNMKFIFRLF